MNQSLGQMERLPRHRLRALVVPREHGAWGMLLVPLASGAAVGLDTGDRAWQVLLFALAALLLFWMRTPVESWLGTTPARAQTPEERHCVLLVMTVLASLSTAALSTLLWSGNRELLVIGAAAGVAFAAQALVKNFGRPLRMPAQMIGAAGLTSCAPAAYYVATGRLDERALGLWLANWLFAANQIHFVQLRIHTAKVSGLAAQARVGRVFFAGQMAMITAILVASWSELFPWLLVVAFVPALLRGFAWFLQTGKPLAVRRLGWSELMHAIVFGILLAVGFRLGG